MKILVTGGAGFIGSWVADAFIGEGHRVLIVDDLSSGYEENIPKEADFAKGDIRKCEFLEKVFSDFEPDIVNHHAAQINVRRSVADPMFDASVNIIGTLNLLELSVKHKIKRFMFASTGGAIYGEPENLPADENTPPIPISPYGVAKYAVEKYLGYYKAVYGLDYIALRYANVYGPRQNQHGEAGVVAIFCSHILSGRPCKVFGDGKQTRDYVFVEDVANANMLGINAPCGSYNIGTGRESSVNDIINILYKSTGREFKVEHTPPLPEEVCRIALDTKLAKRVLGWSPTVNLEEGISQTWKWFSEKI
ncbi:MAG TPA: NAD-dependent epimerase/dehydratase family protein [Thermodesulfobacteriota bacterium]|nr:NAD-dependent epimerase/dehydratase family protein [Thermodesulfobacteriota bacterium]